MPQYYSISHAGIPGMKWHRRRWRNYDGSLTEAGKIRYGVGGDKAVKKAEKEKRRRDKILSDPKKLQRHANEFSTEELQKAKTRFDAINELKNQYRLEKLADAKNKTDIANAKANTEKQKADAKAAKQRAKFDKIRFENEEARKKEDQERKVEREKKEAKATTWKQRVTKLSSVLALATSGKQIFDELGVTDPKDGKTLFGSLGKAMGWDKKVVGEVLGGSEQKDTSSSKSEKSEKAESQKAESKPNSEPSSQNESKSSSNGFAGWEYDNKYKDTTKKNLRSMERDEKKAYKEYVKNYNAEMKKSQKQADAMVKEREDAIKSAFDPKKSAKSEKYDYDYRMTKALDSSHNAVVRTSDSIASSLSEQISSFIDTTAANRAAARYKRYERAQKGGNARWRGIATKPGLQRSTHDLSNNEYYNQMSTLLKTNLGDVLNKYKG